MTATLYLHDYIKSMNQASPDDIEAYHRETAAWLNTQPAFERMHRACGVYVISYLTGEYLYTNTQFSRIVEVPMERMNDRNYWNSDRKLYPPDRVIHHEHIFKKNLSFFDTVVPTLHPQYLMQCTYRIRTADKTLRTLMQASYFIRSTPQGKPVIALGFITDVTEVPLHNTLSWAIKRDTAIVQSQTFLSLDRPPTITKQELAVLTLMCEGRTTKEIARTLHISEYTVGNHRQHIYTKTHCRNAVEVARYAREYGLT